MSSYRSIFGFSRGRSLFVPVLALIISLPVAGILTGCTANFTPSAVESTLTPIGNIQGSVHGGQNPVTGAQIYLYEASTAGYGTAATSLICNKNLMSGAKLASCESTANVYQDSSQNYYMQTDINGNFALAGDYVCTSGDQVYMVAIGGNPGLVGPSTKATFSKNSNTITVVSATGIDVGASISGTGIGSGNVNTVASVSGTTVTLSQQTSSAGSGVSVTFGVNNTAIVQMAAIGECPSSGSMASQVPYLVINEATTVAFAYAVSGFATTPYNVSTDATGVKALENAFATANNLVNLSNGQAPSTFNGNTNSSNSQAKINTLANILSTCVNTSTPTSSNCESLYKYATTTSGTQATDEGSAIFNIAHNQAVQIINGTNVTQNATNLFNLSQGASVFSPTVKSVTDWTLPVIYSGVISTPSTSGTPTSGPYNIAFDGSGNAWIGDRKNGVVEIQPQGTVSTFSSGFSMVKGVAVSPQDGTIWVSDFGKSVVDVLDSSGNMQTTIKNNNLSGPVLTGFTVNPTGTPSDDYLAFEVSETTAGILVFDASNGYGLVHNANNSNYTYVTSPGWITIDSYGAAWIPSINNGYVGSLAVQYKNGTQSYPASETNLGYGYSTTAETMGTAGDSTGNIWAATGVGGSVLVQFSGPNIGGEYTAGGLNNPEKTFVDGNNTVWVANAGANDISGLYTAGGTYNAPWLSSTGFATSAANGTGCTAIGVDPSGNVWVGNSDQSVTMLPGLGTPTAAPLYAGTTIITGTGRTAVTALTNGNLGTKP